MFNFSLFSSLDTISVTKRWSEVAYTWSDPLDYLEGAISSSQKMNIQQELKLTKEWVD